MGANCTVRMDVAIELHRCNAGVLVAASTGATVMTLYGVVWVWEVWVAQRGTALGRVSLSHAARTLSLWCAPWHVCTDVSRIMVRCLCSALGHP